MVYNPYEATLPRGDYFGFKGGLPIFTERAVSALRGVIEQTGELLPVECSEEALYGFNVTTVLEDALDVEHTEAGRFSDGSLAHITKYAFHAGAVRDLLVFRVKQQPSDIYVTDAFIGLVERATLKGFAFKSVWSSQGELAHRVPRETVFSEAEEPDMQEEEIPAGDIEVVKGATDEATRYLRLMGRETPKEVVERITSAVTYLREHPLVKDEESRHAVMLGALFGEQVVYAYGWAWAQVGTAERMAFAVVALDRSVYIEPLQFVWQYLIDKERDITLLLTFNMLARPHPTAEDGSYTPVL